MKYLKRSKTYSGSNVSFDPIGMKAYSYGWWCFVKRINGKIVFNNYNYSNSTCKHQHKVGQLMRELGIKVDLYVSTNYALTGSGRYGQSVDEKSAGLDALKRAYRLQDFEKVKAIKKVYRIRVSQEEIAKIYQLEEERLCNEFLTRSIRRQEKLELEKFQAMHRKLETYLENDVAFRDYEILHRNAFGDPDNKYATQVAVHQVVDEESMEQDVQNAIHNFQRDGFGKIVFYVGGVQ